MSSGTIVAEHRQLSSERFGSDGYVWVVNRLHWDGMARPRQSGDQKVVIVMTTDVERSWVIAWDAGIVERGIFTAGALSVSYYTSNPAPTQWVAVGVARGARMLVGTGPTQAEAIGALAARFEQAEEGPLDAETAFATEWAF